MANDGTRTHRCAACDQDWPYTTQYVKCPICGEETYTTTTHDILTHTDAGVVIAKHRAEIAKREEIERQMDDAFVAAALATLDDELGSLLC